MKIIFKKQIPLFKSISKILPFFLLIFAMGMSFNSEAQMCIQQHSATGLDNAGTTASITGLTCQGGGVITAVTMDASIGTACMIGWWYDYNIVVNGTTIAYNQCNQTGYNLTSYLPITSVAIVSVDQNFIPNTVTMNLLLNITYTSTPCSGTPAGGATVVSQLAACNGDTIGLSLSGQTTAPGIDYQWQQSSDNVTWTDMVNDTLDYADFVVSSSTYFRCEQTCTSSGITSYSSVDSVLSAHCTPPTPVTCSLDNGGGVETLTLTGWQGVPTSSAIITFEYDGYMNASSPNDYLVVQDVYGATIKILNGGIQFCGSATDTAIITQSHLSSLLAAGNGNVVLTVTASNSVSNFCPFSSTPKHSYCISASMKAENYVYANDASLLQVNSPGTGLCVLDSMVTVVIKNEGSNALTSLNIEHSVNGLSQGVTAWTGNLVSGGLDTVNLGVFAGGFSDGDTLVSWVSSPNAAIDSNSIGDTNTAEVHSSLNGTYVVNANGTGDFLSFTHALNTLETYGVCGPVIIEAVNGTYVEQIVFNSSIIQGVDSVNTITFQSQSGIPSQVTISHQANTNINNFVWEFKYAQYVSLKDLTLESLGANHFRVLSATVGGANNVILDNCIFRAPAQTQNSQKNAILYAYGDSLNNWTIEGCEFINGTRGIYFGISSDFGNDNAIIDNIFDNQYVDAVTFRYQVDSEVSGNLITSNSNLVNSGSGIYLQNLTGSSSVFNNQVIGNGVWPKYGIYASTCSGSATDPINVFNNRVSMPLGGYYGMSIGNGSHVNVYHNSIYKSGGNTVNAALSIANGSDINVLNNNVQMGGLGTALQLYGDPLNICNYNNLSAPIGAVADSGSAYTTLAAWIAASGYDSNSVNVNDAFTDSVNLISCTDSLYGMGLPIIGMTEDFENDPRQTNPCIGADEFMPLTYVGYPNDIELCTGDTILLSQYYYDVVVWDINDTSNTLQITSTGSHSLYVSGSCGSNSSMFTVVPQQNASIGDQVICANDSVQLFSGISNATYLWSNGSTDSTIWVDSAQTVTVQVVSAFGCSSADTASITQSPVVDLADDSTSFCQGANVVLTANISGSYLWNTGSTTQFISVNTPGTYSVTVTDGNCVSEDSTHVQEVLNVVPLFTDSVDGKTVYFKNQSSFADSYYWDFGDGNNSVLENPVHTYAAPSSTWSYVVTLTATNSCGDNEFILEVDNEPNGVSALSFMKLISVLPNPATDVATLQFELQGINKVDISVINSAGSVVITQDLGVISGSVNYPFNVNELPTGLYLIQVSVNGQMGTLKLIVN